MKKIFYSHTNVIIAALALIFLGILVAFYSWAINSIFLEVHQALTASSPQAGDSFDLAAAARLDLRDGVSASSSVTGTAGQ